LGSKDLVIRFWNDAPSKIEDHGTIRALARSSELDLGSESAEVSLSLTMTKKPCISLSPNSDLQGMSQFSIKLLGCEMSRGSQLSEISRLSLGLRYS
jgi:hypothetical protein